jgi:hypothetical protein
MLIYYIHHRLSSIDAIWVFISQKKILVSPDRELVYHAWKFNLPDHERF